MNEQLQLDPIEQIVTGILRRNWYRIARYDNPNMAVPAIENVAREIARALRHV